MSWCEYPGWLVGNEVFQNYGCRMFGGLWVTFQLVAISVAIGFALAIGLAVARLYGPRWAQIAINGSLSIGVAPRRRAALCRR